MKIAVYVEGHAELIFVRELLCKWFGYDAAQIGFRCYHLRDKVPPGVSTDYAYGGTESAYFYEIVNVGTDVSVISQAIKNAPRYKNLGYDRVVALRDMYCDVYHVAAYNAGCPRTINENLNNRFVEGAEKSVRDKGFDGFLSVNFAIMEVEAWLLGMGWYLEQENSRLTQNYLLGKLAFDLECDQEQTEYHPANRLDCIYRHIGSQYGKHQDEIYSIMSKLGKEDFMLLLDLPKCGSFNRFISNLIPSAESTVR